MSYQPPPSTPATQQPTTSQDSRTSSAGRWRAVTANPYVWFVVIVTVAGAVLRFWELGRQSYWYDEAVTVTLMRSSFLGMLHALPSSESTPPLYYVIAWPWSKVFGTGEAALRSLSAVVGTLAIPVAYGAGKELVSKRAGALAATLTALSPFLIWYSQEARAYSLFVVISALSLWTFARAWASPDRRRLAWWATVASLALWTQYFALFLVVAEASLLLVRPATRRLAYRPIIGVALAGAAIAPLAYRQAHNGRNTWIAATPLHARATSAAKWFLIGPEFVAHVWWIAAAVALVGATSVGLIRTRSERRGAAIAFALAAAAILLPLLMAAAGHDFWLYRNLIAAWIPLAIALAAGLTTRRDASVLVTRGILTLAITAVVLSGVFAIRVAQGSIERENWRGVAGCLGQRQPDRALLVYPSFQATVLQLYQPEAQPMRGRRTIREIDVVGDPPTFTTPSGFHRAGSRCLESIPVTVYKASEPRLMAPIQIAPQPSPGSQPAIALVEGRN